LLTVVLSIYLKAIFVLIILSFMADNKFSNMPEAAGNMFSLGIALYFIVLLSAIIRLVKGNQKKVSTPEEVKVTHLQIRSNRKNVKLPLNDVFYIESLSDYVRIHYGNEAVITKEKISKILDRLPAEFIRIHRSYIVNTLMVKSFTKEKVHVKSEELPISRTYKREAIEKLQIDV